MSGISKFPIYSNSDTSYRYLVSKKSIDRIEKIHIDCRERGVVSVGVSYRKYRYIIPLYRVQNLDISYQKFRCRWGYCRERGVISVGHRITNFDIFELRCIASKASIYRIEPSLYIMLNDSIHRSECVFRPRFPLASTRFVR